MSITAPLAEKRPKVPWVVPPPHVGRQVNQLVGVGAMLGHREGGLEPDQHLQGAEVPERCFVLGAHVACHFVTQGH